MTKLIPDPRLPGYRWDPVQRAYIELATGAVVPRTKVRTLLYRSMDALADQAQGLGEAYRLGEIGLGQFHAEMIQVVREAHTVGAASFQGGVNYLTMDDWRRVDRMVTSEIRYLRNFVAQVEDGTQRADGTLPRRARQYALAGNTTAWQMEEEWAEEHGMEEERRQLTPADHCEDCVAYAARGWVPLGTLPMPGEDAACHRNCKCIYSTRKRTGPWAERPLQPGLADVDYLRAKEGVTVNPRSGLIQHKGFAFSERPDREATIPLNELRPGHITGYIRDNADIYQSDRLAFFGAWQAKDDEGRPVWFFDVSTTIRGDHRLKEAIDRAFDSRQLAIFDLERFQEIETGYKTDGTGIPITRLGTWDKIQAKILRGGE